MKRILILTAILVFACSSDDSNSSVNNNTFNPPTWIQGVWLKSNVQFEAGFEFRQPGCSACLAMNEDKIPKGKYCVSTSNRNFEGRQGPGSRTFLASPATAALTAVNGFISDVRDYN